MTSLQDTFSNAFFGGLTPTARESIEGMTPTTCSACPDATVCGAPVWIAFHAQDLLRGSRRATMGNVRRRADVRSPLLGRLFLRGPSARAVLPRRPVASSSHLHTARGPRRNGQGGGPGLCSHLPGCRTRLGGRVPLPTRARAGTPQGRAVASPAFPGRLQARSPLCYWPAAARGRQSPRAGFSSAPGQPVDGSSPHEPLRAAQPRVAGGSPLVELVRAEMERRSLHHAGSRSASAPHHNRCLRLVGLLRGVSTPLIVMALADQVVPRSEPAERGLPH